MTKGERIAMEDKARLAAMAAFNKFIKKCREMDRKPAYYTKAIKNWVREDFKQEFLTDNNLPADTILFDVKMTLNALMIKDTLSAYPRKMHKLCTMLQLVVLLPTTSNF